MALPTAESDLAATVARYSISPARFSTALHIAQARFRWDVLDAEVRTPVFSLLRFGARTLWLDHGARTYRPVEAALAQRSGPLLRDPRIESTRFGPALVFPQALAAPATMELAVLQLHTFPALAAWWSFAFPGAVPPGLTQHLPYAFTLRQSDSGEPGARVLLQELEQVRVPATFFHLPEGYRPAEGDGRVLRGRPAPPDPPRPPRTISRESALGALLSGASDEATRLQLRDEVVGRIARAVNDVSTRISAFSGEGLTLDLLPLLTFLGTPSPTTPAGTPALAGRLILRVLLWHMGIRLKTMFGNALRPATEMLIAALENNDSNGALQIEPAGSEITTEQRELFRTMRDFIAGSSAALLPVLQAIRDADHPAEHIDLTTVGTLPVGDPLELAARAWFRAHFRHVNLQPEPFLRQKNGKSTGWRTNGFIAEGLGLLIDLELSFQSVRLNAGNAPVLGSTRFIDDTDARFATLDATLNSTPGLRKRAGFVIPLSLAGVTLNVSASTVPTTNSPVVAALLLLQPQEFVKLWSYSEATITLTGLSADLIVYFEQERLSPAGPDLKFWVGNVAAASLEIAGFFLSADLLLQQIGDLILNVVLEELTPAFIDQLRAAFFRALDRATMLVEDSLASLFNVTLPARVPRVLGSTAADVQQMFSHGLTLRQNMRLQHMLNLNREEEFERLTGIVQDRRAARNTAFLEQDRLWTVHVMAAGQARVTVPAAGFNPRTLPRPIINNENVALSAATIALLQATYDAWFTQLGLANQREAEQSAVQADLQEFLDDWPEGQTAAEGLTEPDGGYRLALGICRPAAGSTGRALVFPPTMTPQYADLTLLVSTRTFSEMTGGIVVGYQGDVRNTDGNAAVLPQLPAIDWWQDAQDSALLGPRPTGLRDGPPPIDPGAPGSGADWRAYWSILQVSGRGARLRPGIVNPRPDEPVADIYVSVSVLAGLTTYTPIAVERCGPDLTRLAGELERPRLGDPGRFRPPAGPGEPRPRPDLTTGIDIETGFRRVPHALEPQIVTGAALENARIRTGLNGGAGLLGGLDNVLFSPGPGIGGFAGDAHCRVITAWDVREREVWLEARLEVRFPVFLGFANVRPDNSTNLPSSGVQDFDVLNTRAGLPILTYRFLTDPVLPRGPFIRSASGPLSGLLQGANLPWFEQLLANHATALVRNLVSPHRDRRDELFYAYGTSGAGVLLVPENFTPFGMLAMHPTHWSAPVPPEVTSRPPFITLETFGSNPDAPNLAVHLYAVESLLDKLGM